jgi:MFS family permease
MPALRNVLVIFIAMGLLQLANGLLGTLIPLAMKADGHDAGGIGLVGAAYAAGFMLGAALAPLVLSRIGHIRVFASAGGIASAATLMVWGLDPLGAWMAARLVTGVAVAMMFAAGESWLNGALTRETRGGTIGLYMVSARIALAIGPFLAAGAVAGDPAPFMIAAGAIALSLVPLCATQQAQPAAPSAAFFSVARLTATAPAAVIAAFAAGFINTGVLTLAPIWIEQALGPASIAMVMAAIWLGSMVVQFPAGRLSDRIDRRLVIALLSGTAALSAGAMLVLDWQGLLTPGTALLLAAIWGGGALSYYGVAAAHMADRTEPAEMARATAGLLFVWAGGSVLGPVATGILAATPLGYDAVWWAGAVGGSLLVFAMVGRRLARAEVLVKRVFRPKPETSVAAAEIAFDPDPDPGSGDAGHRGGRG